MRQRSSVSGSAIISRSCDLPGKKETIFAHANSHMDLWGRQLVLAALESANSVVIQLQTWWKLPRMPKRPLWGFCNPCNLQDKLPSFMTVRLATLIRQIWLVATTVPTTSWLKTKMSLTLMETVQSGYRTHSWPRKTSCRDSSEKGSQATWNNLA